LIEKKFRLAIVGTGKMAQTMYHAMSLVPSIDVNWVVSHSKERSESFASKYSIANFTDELQRMLDDEHVDAVYVVNRTRDHSSTSIACLQAGKAVLCEKPCATNAADTAEIIATAREQNVLFLEGIWTLCLPVFIEAKRLIDSDQFGVLSSINASFGYPVSDTDTQRMFNTNDGGVLLDRAVYLIALAIQYFGKPLNYYSYCNKDNHSVELESTVLLEHENNRHSILQVSAKTLLSNSVEFSLEKGSLRFSDSLAAESFKNIYFNSHLMADAGSANSGVKITLKNILKSNYFLRRLKRALSRDKTHHYSYGSNQYLPMLNHFCELLVDEKKDSALIPHSLTLDVSRCIDDLLQMESLDMAEGSG